MRADRLIQIVLLLQKRRRASARELAEELGVSRRTIFRDMDALGSIGIPIYAEPGSEGGYCLVENYRTSLSRLTPDEISALLAFSFPEPLADLDIGHKIRTALLKLYALADTGQHFIYLDWTPLSRGHEPVPHLQTLYQALQEARALSIHYRLPGDVAIEQVVEPYGLVAKAGVWYFVYRVNGHFRHQRAARLLNVCVLDQPFTREPNFDLERYWKTVNDEQGRASVRFKTVLRVSPAVVRWLPYLLGRHVSTSDQKPDSDGWFQLDLCFESLEAARQQILAMGGGVEVLEPLALRLSVQDFAAQILQVYTDH